jgi:glycosyltransferase involved in cell wall biosynthesis
VISNSVQPLIAIYLPSLRGGGAERVMVTLANAFADQGYTVDLVLASATGPYLPEVSPSVHVVDLGKSRVITSLPALVKYLRQRQPTAMLSAMGHANLIALLANRFAGGKTRVVVSERNDASVGTNQQKRLRSSVIQFLNRLLYLNADAVHAVSQGVANSSAKQLGMPREKISVVYNPVVTDKILKLAQAHERYPWLPNKSRPMILASGRLTKQKDFPTLIRAFALLRKRLDASLVIMGEGELRPQIEHLITEHDLQEHVLLPGFVENPFSVMNQADLFVLSSAWEGLPNVLIQAMACGTPVVSTDCPSGPAEILEDGKWGRLVPVGNVDALAQAMIDTLTEKEHPDVASRAAFFSVERAVDGYLSLLLPDAMK